MKKILSRGAMVLGSFLAIFGVVSAKLAHAAADADLVAGFASSTAIFTDNKGAIITYVVSIVLVITVVSLIIRGLFFGKGLLTGVFGGRKRRR